MGCHRGLRASRSPQFPEWRNAPAFEFPPRPFLESDRARPSPRRQAVRSQARFGICAPPTKCCPSLAGNNDRSRAKIKALRKRGKRFVRQKKSLRRESPERLRKWIIEIRLANPGPDKPAVVFDADPATGEKVSDGRDGFLRVFRARTHRQDEITEGKFGALLKDQSILFH